MTVSAFVQAIQGNVKKFPNRIVFPTQWGGHENDITVKIQDTSYKKARSTQINTRS